MKELPSTNPYEQLRARLRQLILMRETGPKSAAWHAARMRMIWRLHDELRQVEELEPRTKNREPDDPYDPTSSLHR
jgi:hypothetical protein